MARSSESRSLWRLAVADTHSPRDGVGYINYILQAWECKRCGDGHTPYRVVSDDEYMAEQKAILDALGVNQYAG